MSLEKYIIYTLDNWYLIQH